MDSDPVRFLRPVTKYFLSESRATEPPKRRSVAQSLRGKPWTIAVK